MTQPQISDDGNYQWNGTEWVQNVTTPLPPIPTKKPTSPWLILGVIGAAILLLFGGCAALVTTADTSGTNSAPQAQAPVVPAPAPAPEVQQAPADDVIDKDLAEVMLESVWEDQPAESRQSICDAWALGGEAQQVVLDALVGELSDDVALTESDFRRFFNRVC